MKHVRWPEGEGIRATRISRAFEGVNALEQVDLELHRHEIVGLIGPNGAGKTTLVNCMTGFDLPDDGSVALDGEDITGWPAARRARAGLARTFQHGHLFGGLSVRENVEVAALGTGASAAAARRRAYELLELLGLADRAGLEARVLPHGDEMKLGVARSLATEPRYVLMDEPAAGLSDAEVPVFAGVLRWVRDEHNAGVLVIDHNMALIMDVCDRIYVLDQGKPIAHGPPESVRRDVHVAAAYLGGDMRETPGEKDA